MLNENRRVTWAELHRFYGLRRRYGEENRRSVSAERIIHNHSPGLYSKLASHYFYEGLMITTPSGFAASMNTLRPSTRKRPSAKSCTARG